jgi:L-ascorbate metabolism protein UlaG (beta-lactamase superfamily)
LELTAPDDAVLRLERSADLLVWAALRTFRSNGSDELLDGGPLSAGTGFYRVREVTEPDALTGDHLSTEQGDLLIHVVDHASFVMRWGDLTIYNDPVGGAAPYDGLPRADLILVSHQHGDHFNAGTIQAVRAPEGLIIAPASVYGALSPALRAASIPMANGESTNVLGMIIEAVPAYNDRHPRGAGNGYVLTVGGRRLYMSGDTGAIPETRELTAIDVAFLSMNLPFTMSVSQAAGVIRDFRPRVLYPYHYRNQDGSLANLEALKRDVGRDAGVEIRVRDWY